MAFIEGTPMSSIFLKPESVKIGVPSINAMLPPNIRADVLWFELISSHVGDHSGVSVVRRTSEKLSQLFLTRNARLTSV